MSKSKFPTTTTRLQEVNQIPEKKLQAAILQDASTTLTKYA
jgi:hypothetical protein